MSNKIFFSKWNLKTVKLAAALCLFFFAAHGAFAAEAITDANPMRIPAVGDYGLRIIT